MLTHLDSKIYMQIRMRFIMKLNDKEKKAEWIRNSKIKYDRSLKKWIKIKDNK